MKEPKCKICKDDKWVCENHPEVSFEGGNKTCCGGAGSPCVCNPVADPNFLDDSFN